MIRRLTLILPLLSIACASPTASMPGATELRSGEPVSGVILSLSQAAYSHGDEARVRLSNTSNVEVGYNSCTAARERLTAGEWVRIHPLRVCTAAIYPLPPGERIEFEEEITADWDPGRYRIILPVYLPTDAAPQYVATPSFDVSG